MLPAWRVFSCSRSFGAGPADVTHQAPLQGRSDGNQGGTNSASMAASEKSQTSEMAKYNLLRDMIPPQAKVGIHCSYAHQVSICSEERTPPENQVPSTLREMRSMAS